jgi:hypothetical protein
LITPDCVNLPIPGHPMADPYPSKEFLQPKFIGNMNIDKPHLKRILLDKQAQ